MEKGERMKAITIKQPWATLIALGLKEFETRSWATKHRGSIAIHAGKSIDKEAYEDFSNDLKAVGIENIKQLPIGSVIATASLVECHKVIKEYPKQNTAEVAEFYIDGKEYNYGFYEPGRYAWQLSNVKAIEPVPAKGQLSLWNWNDGSK